MKKLVAAALIGLVCLSGAALAGAPEGGWLSEDGGAKVHVANCGGKLCRTVVWLNEPNDSQTSKPETDMPNPIRPNARGPCSACRWCSASPPTARTNGQAKSTMPTMAEPTARA